MPDCFPKLVDGTIPLLSREGTKNECEWNYGFTAAFVAVLYSYSITEWVNKVDPARAPLFAVSDTESSPPISQPPFLRTQRLSPSNAQISVQYSANPTRSRAPGHIADQCAPFQDCQVAITQIDISQSDYRHCSGVLALLT